MSWLYFFAGRRTLLVKWLMLTCVMMLPNWLTLIETGKKANLTQYYSKLSIDLIGHAHRPIWSGINETLLQFLLILWIRFYFYVFHSFSFFWILVILFCVFVIFIIICHPLPQYVYTVWITFYFRFSFSYFSTSSTTHQVLPLVLHENENFFLSN